MPKNRTPKPRGLNYARGLVLNKKIKTLEREIKEYEAKIERCEIVFYDGKDHTFYPFFFHTHNQRRNRLKDENEATSEMNAGYLRNLKWHIKARKERQSVSIKDKEAFAADIDKSNDVVCMERLLEVMGGLIQESEATHEELGSLNHEGFNQQER